MLCQQSPPCPLHSCTQHAQLESTGQSIVICLAADTLPCLSDAALLLLWLVGIVHVSVRVTPCFGLTMLLLVKAWQCTPPRGGPSAHASLITACFQSPAYSSATCMVPICHTLGPKAATKLHLLSLQTPNGVVSCRTGYHCRAGCQQEQARRPTPSSPSWRTWNGCRALPRLFPQPLPSSR